MPKGSSPREVSLAKLSLLDKQITNATRPSLLEKIKLQIDLRTKGVSLTKPQSVKVKALRSKIKKRSASLLANSSKNIDKAQTP